MRSDLIDFWVQIHARQDLDHFSVFDVGLCMTIVWDLC